MRILSIDLASKRSEDLGVAVLATGRPARATLIDHRRYARAGDLSAPVLADALVSIAEAEGCRWIAVDGPSGWKSAANRLDHSRACDRAINAPAKVGLPGVVKPAPYRGFVEFSIGLFDALAGHGYARLGTGPSPGRRTALEIFPSLCWRRLGLPHLPAKAKCRSGLLAWRRALRGVVACSGAPTHDQLQAIIGGLAPLWLGSGQAERVEVVGREPVIEDGLWREGFVVVPGTPVPCILGAHEAGRGVRQRGRREVDARPAPG